MTITRREFLNSVAGLGAGSLLALPPLAGTANAAAAAAGVAGDRRTVKLAWLDGRPPQLATGVAWGVPWPRGTVAKAAHIGVRNDAGNIVPAQSWPMAYWPDGSVKWTGLAIAADAGLGSLVATVDASAAPVPRALTVVQTVDQVVVDTGSVVARVNRRGRNVIASLAVEGREVARDGHLVAHRIVRSTEDGQQVGRRQAYASTISDVTVEQSGPVRAVLHVQGHHSGHDRRWLPFSVRLYFTRGLNTIRMVHSFVFDGDQAADFIGGLGLSFTVPFREELQNRHIRFATDADNLFAEPVLMAPGYRPRAMQQAAAYQAAQIRGEPIPNLADLPDASRRGILSTPVWDQFKIRQLSADGWDLFKRTNNDSAWLHVTGGARCRGLAFLGDVRGGLAVGIKNFWQKYPSSFDIANAASGAGDMKVWFWSPDAEPMDLRHYDTRRHALDVVYEDERDIARANAYGCANTTELTLWATPDTPSPALFKAMTDASAQPPMVICTPRHYHDTATLGVWSLPGAPAPGLTPQDLAAAETQLDRAFAFQQGEVERRRWYGFWDYGDYRRTYDPVRHQWLYDIGGHGWNATELMPNMWLWFAFLRSGRADLFRAAEDMTRNTMEVDVYHLGPYAGTGSRHNVSHWGDGAKEPRINMAHLKRFHYYLTTGERTGDLLREPLTTVETTIGRYLDHGPTIGNEIALRLAPDWQTLASNWYTEWERTGDVRYRDYCLAGMQDMGAVSERQFADGSYYMDTRTKRLRPAGTNPNGHFTVLFGGDQIIHDLLASIPCPSFERAWNHRLQSLIEAKTGNDNFDTRVTAYVAAVTGQPNLQTRAVTLYRGLLTRRGHENFPATYTLVDGPATPQPALEHPARGTMPAVMATPDVAQWALNLVTAPEWLRLAAQRQADGNRFGSLPARATSRTPTHD